MTRKRFVKLLMSQGMSRNTANTCAAYVVTSNKSYEVEYKSYDVAYKLSGAFSSLGSSFRKTIEAISTVCNAIGVAASAFSSVLTVSMQNPETFGGRCPKCGGTGLEARI